MKPRFALLLAVFTLVCGIGAGWRLAVAYHQPKFEHFGWSISQFHGSYSTFAFGATNGDLEFKIKEITGSPDARAFVIPGMSHYTLYYYVPERLSSKRDEELRDYVTERLEAHEAEWTKVNARKA